MNKSTKADIQTYINNWKDASEYLEKERIERLRNMTDEETRAIIERLFSDNYRPAPVIRICGLIEQQRIFHKLPE